VIPWIGIGDFSTKGEPREASVAVSMIESGNWVLPTTYANEFAFKPPMAHWLMAISSLPEGHVTEFSSRLPSALAFIILAGFMLAFFGKRLRFQEAFVATLLFISCVEIHRAAMTTRVDMILTTFIVIGLFQLYRWEDLDELKGLPIAIPILLGCATLTKGPVGIILPLFVFGVYLLMLRKYSIREIFKALLYAGVSSLFIPIVWYMAAWKRGGDQFMDMVIAENFGRFFSTSSDKIAYELGHENGVWYNFLTIILGFMPWTILFVFSLFGIKVTLPHKSLKKAITDGWISILSMEKEKLFSLVALVCIIFFYSIPSSKRSVYLMPAYPFIAIFLAQYALYITEYRRLITRAFAWVIGISVSLTAIFSGAIMTGAIDVENMTTKCPFMRNIIEKNDFTMYLVNHSAITIIIYLVLLLALGILFYQLLKKINIKILYATIGLTLATYLMVDGVVMRSIRNSASSKQVAELIIDEYSKDGSDLYVVNNLRKYPNLYGLNFYLGNKLQDIDKERPSSGYFICTKKMLPVIKQDYAGKYDFKEVKSFGKIISDVRDDISICEFTSVK
jgi:hypothetical protein